MADAPKLPKPQKPGRDPQGRFPTLQDIRKWASTQEINAADLTVPESIEPKDADLKVPMRSYGPAIAFVLILLVTLGIVAALYFSRRH